MKRILITGKNSYIGTSVEKWLNRYPNDYQIHTIDMKDGSWKNSDFSSYDVVFHVAGIAHADVGKVSIKKKDLYYQVNTDLTVKVAKKFRDDSISNIGKRKKQFIFMSSIIVYGEETHVNAKRVITTETELNPSGFYGDSKLQAEKGLLPLESENFQVVILRPPMIYGPGSKGNYSQLSKLAKRIPIFPNFFNERSMLFVDNLAELIRLLINSNSKGIFFPQNSEYVQTSRMVKSISEISGNKVRFIGSLNWFVKILGYFPGKIGNLVNKAFGNLVYDKKLSVYEEIGNYQIVDFNASIKKTES